MPLVGKVGRKSPRARFAMLAVYLLLCLGALTTVYPFLLMISTGFKGPTDQNDSRVVPAFWSDIESIDAKGKPAEGSLYHKYLVDKYAGDQSAISSSRLGASSDPGTTMVYERFLLDLPNDYWTVGFRPAPAQGPSKLLMRYQEWLRGRYSSINDLNRAYTEENVAFQTVQVPIELWERPNWNPSPSRKREDWEIFKRGLEAEFRVPVREERMFQEYARTRCENQFARVPEAVRGKASRFEELRLQDGGAWLEEFRQIKLPARYKSATTESLWATIHAGALPIEAYERTFIRQNAQTLRQEFSTRHYRYVLDYILLHGRALSNTALFCLLAVLTQLTVNPLAAYALSRYPIRASGKILLFLLATMAFPAEVAMIPSFLLLKDLGLLNTFVALVLPTAASGYMIFLLKGFFDSLPQELFESGQIDGAPEHTMMLRIALPLSKPVLGYLALVAFMGAYGAFMYAFLVAQDQKMWTLMVWIYQLQQSAPKATMMAALTLAAIPTLFVFLAAQRTIMRGIVLPGER